LRGQELISWQGRHRSGLHDVEVSLRPLARLPIWIGAGGTPQSAVRAGTLGLPLNLANIGGQLAQFKPFIDLYRRTGEQAGNAASALRVAVSVSGHLHVQRDSQRAMDEFYPHYAIYMQHNLPQRDRGWPVSRATYEQLASPTGYFFCVFQRSWTPVSG
jgi:alkanesulfonate monooxygenase SsuD/methylene tetrahydromethanopterin reductase-like flavin-dependent oxidoreductase (luciferase family)